MSCDEEALHGLRDTTTLLLLRALDTASELPEEPLISTITLAELSAGPLVADSPQQRQARQALLQQVEADFDPLPFDEAAARTFGRVAVSLRRAGRKTAAATYDAMIAAIVIANDLAVYTCNPDGFTGIEGLDTSYPPRYHSSRKPTAHLTRRSCRFPDQCGNGGY